MRFLLGLLISTAVSGQSFEVASIRPHVFTGSGGGKLGVSISGNRVTVSTVTLNRLIIAAYGVKDYQISGGPGWASAADTTFDIAAKVEGDAAPTMEQVNVMLQNLLAERFQLKLHRETKDLPVYDLVPLKSGVKVKESAPDAKTGVQSRLGGLTGEFTATAVGMEQLARLLSQDAGRPVLDKSGLSAKYDFKLQWSRDQQPDDSGGASLFTAVQEQLGVKLEPSKAATEMLVIDHAEKPTEN
jgi:uncharacterized protein (TIGR03435 family)